MEGMENANAKSKQKSIVRFCSFLRDLPKMLQNAQKIQRIRMQTSPQATRMFHSRRMVMSNRTIDRKCTLILRNAKQGTFRKIGRPRNTSRITNYANVVAILSVFEFVQEGNRFVNKLLEFVP